MALDLRELKKCITERDLVSITLESDDSPHRIFESLNNTGMQLGASDLIRNLIFMNISGEAETQDAYDRHWYPMQEATSTDLDDFFWRYRWMGACLGRMRPLEIKNHCRVGDNSRTIQTLLQFAKFAKYYRQLREMGGEQTEAGLLREIRRLNTWEASVAYPFLMRSLDWVNDRLISSDDLAHVVRMIESFVVRRTVCNVPTNRLRGIFAQMSMQVGSEDFVASSRNYLLGDHWPTDEEFKVAFVSFNAYARRLARTRLILESLEESFGHPEIPKMTEKITIEHLMPQTLTSEWETMLGPQAKEIHSRWLHTPGNLTLTGFNSELGNASFSEKKVLLEESKFSLTDSVLRCNQWDESKIRDRGEALADRAIQIWRR